MKVLITGYCGFVGTSVAEALVDHLPDLALHGIDNLIRPGVYLNRARFEAVCGKFWHGDLRAASDLDALPEVDWVIDAAANPSVLGGVDGHSSARQVVEHNLAGTVNLLEYCRQHGAGLILLSTSRVYSIPVLGFEGRGLQVRDVFHPRDLTVVLAKQLSEPGDQDAERTFNLGGGLEGSMSLAELSGWCVERFGPRQVDAVLAPDPLIYPASLWTRHRPGST